MSSRALAGIAAAGAALALAAPAGAASYPKIAELVVFRDGSTLQGQVTSKQVTVKVGGRSCAVGSRTALAALVRLKPPSLALRDYGSCGRRARDAAGLFVRRMAGDANKGFDGWVYKVGQKLATTGAADPTGPFGHGLLKDGQRVTWFYCRLDQETRNCQRTLALKAAPAGPGQITVTVRSYDDRGRSVPAAGATVDADSATATTDANGQATLSVPPGPAFVHATRAGEIRSFEERVEVE